MVEKEPTVTDIHLRVGKDVKEELRKAAKEKGIKVNNLIRIILYEWVKDNRKLKL